MTDSPPSWLDHFIAHEDGRLEIRFFDGRYVNAVELLNPSGDRLTAAELRVLPGETIVLYTSAPTHDVLVEALPPHDPPQDAAGIYSLVSRRVLPPEYGQDPWVLMFRFGGSISNVTVSRLCGDGLYRISVHHALSLAAGGEVLSIREVEIHGGSSDLTCSATMGGDQNGDGAERCGRRVTYRCNNAPNTCDRHKSACCTPITAEAAP